jgi:hypothetical protein
MRCRVRLLRSWWTLLLPFAAVGFLLLAVYGSGWLVPAGTIGCFVCLLVLWLLVTIGACGDVEDTIEPDDVGDGLGDGLGDGPIGP